MSSTADIRVIGPTLFIAHHRGTAWRLRLDSRGRWEVSHRPTFQRRRWNGTVRYRTLDDVMRKVPAFRRPKLVAAIVTTAPPPAAPAPRPQPKRPAPSADPLARKQAALDAALARAIKLAGGAAALLDHLSTKGN